MVKRFEVAWLAGEDKRLAKSTASLKGMKLHEYLGQTIREDARREAERLHQEFSNQNNRRPQLGFFKK